MSVTRAWAFLAVAGVFEVVWAIGLKYTHGFSRPVASAITVAGMGASFWFLALALRVLPVGTAYAVWTGIGAVGTAVLGMALFHESRAAARLICIASIIVGIVGLKLATPAAQP
jgi:quaternary ammonium compound-resistance protein SugE